MPGIDALTKAQHLADVLALWTDDGTFITATGVTYHGKGTPGTASCVLGSLTLCDLYANHRPGLCVGSRLGIADADLYGGHHRIG